MKFPARRNRPYSCNRTGRAGVAQPAGSVPFQRGRTDMPSRTPRLPRFAGLAGLSAAALLAAAAGCESLRSSTPVAAEPPGDATAARAASPSAAPPPAPGRNATRRGPYVFYHDFDADRDDPLFAELEALPEQVYGELRLPQGSTVIQVFLFEDQGRYERFMRAKYRDLPNRRAYFIGPIPGGRGDDLKVYTWMGDHVRTDLRHELTHALLHSVLKDVPLWLDEGLAGFFELAPGTDGVNPSHLDVLRRGPFQPNMDRLERLDQVSQMEKPEYREAWAWVHLMLRGGPVGRQVLQDYLHALRTNPAPGPLLPRLREAFPDPEAALADHLTRLEPPPLRVRR